MNHFWVCNIFQSLVTFGSHYLNRDALIELRHGPKIAENLDANLRGHCTVCSGEVDEDGMTSATRVRSRKSTDYLLACIITINRNATTLLPTYPLRGVYDTHDHDKLMEHCLSSDSSGPYIPLGSFWANTPLFELETNYRVLSNDRSCASQPNQHWRSLSLLGLRAWLPSPSIDAKEYYVSRPLTRPINHAHSVASNWH